MLDFIFEVLKWAGIVVVLIIIAVFAFSIIGARKEREAENLRRANLIQKYGQDIGRRIINREAWIGMTADQVFDALGRPDMVDQKQMAKFYREVYKWRVEGKRRIAYQITCDDGVVTAISDRR